MPDKRRSDRRRPAHEDLRDRLEARLCEISPAAVIFGARPTFANTTLIALPGGKAETLVTP